MPCAVFTLLLVFKHGQIALVTGSGYVVFLHRFQHRATGFMGMCAVGKAAVFRELEYLLEITCKFFRLYVKRSEAADARCVDNPALRFLRHGGRNGQHLAEGRGVHTLVMRVAYLRSAQVCAGYQGVDDGRFANAAVAAEQR